MKKLLSKLALAVSMLTSVTATFAQDSLDVSLGADIMNRYVWRGMDQGVSGGCIQPSIGLSYKGFSIGAWGSTGISDYEAKELDLSLGYSVGGFSATLTDYFWAGESASYGHYTDDHFFELGLSYNFGESLPLTVSWATMFTGGKSAEYDEDGDRMYSSYINLAYDLDVHGVALTPAIGINPLKSQFDDEFSVLDISLTASKEIKITDSFSLPIFVQAIASPAKDKTYLVFGITF